MKISDEKQGQIAGSTIPLGEAPTVTINDPRVEFPRPPFIDLPDPWSAEYMPLQELSDWERALGVVADDPKSLAWQLKVLVLICWGLGILTGVIVVAPLLRAVLAYLGGQ